MAAQDSQLRKNQALLTSEHRISQSSIPLSLQVFGSALFPPRLRAQTFTPPFVLRCGFGAIFAGAGYVLASGDSRNGSGIATAWSLSYFVLEQFSLGLHKSSRLPRSGLSLALSGATAANAILYGTEYFFLTDEESEPD
ncbi:hypothetical protein F5148DRAFT_1278949 [Russula earlei]|uniref:Uncharacterized protein n=1 Tax=Russula earlei TaxID=71964 RepID=A0ACC0UQX2_9AGAM|nr:hypothetical protein F5148DRAFT_1278949 [Russula earlei]